MDCLTSRTLLQECFERTLSSVEQSELDTHLTRCQACQAESVLLKAVVTAIEESPAPQPSEDFTLKIMDRLPVPATGILGVPGDILRVAAAAIAATAVFLGWWYQESLRGFLQSLPEATASGSRPIMPYVEVAFGRIYESWVYTASFLPQIDVERLSPLVSILIATGVAHVILKMVQGFEPLELDELANRAFALSESPPGGAAACPPGEGPPPGRNPRIIR